MKTIGLKIDIAFILLLTLLIFSAIKAGKCQSFTILPDPVLKVKGVTGWSGQSVTYNASDKSFSAPNGLYIPDVYPVTGGLEVEMMVWLPSEAGTLLLKQGTCNYSISSSKLYCGSIPNGYDRSYGMRTIPLNTWVKLRFAFDTVGRSVFQVNDIPDLNRTTIFSGPLPQNTGSQFTFFQNYTGLRCKYIKVWAGTKPVISPTGFNCLTIVSQDTLRLTFDHIDRSELGKPLTIIQEVPQGQQSTLSKPDQALRPGTIKFPMNDLQNGSYTFVMSTAKCQVRKTVFKGPEPVLPKTFLRGMFSVHCSDLGKMKDLGIDAVQTDFQILNTDQNWKAIGKYLDTAGKYELKTLMVMGFQASKGNRQYASRVGQKSLVAYYPQDEAQGFLEGINNNFWANGTLGDSVPVVGNQNVYREELAEYCHILSRNIYNTGDQVYIHTKSASQLRTAWTTLPMYWNVKFDRLTTINLVGQAVCAGASAIFWFDWDERTKSDRTKWYMPNCADCISTIKECNKMLEGCSLKYRELSTGNPFVVAADRGGKVWICNLSGTVQQATISGTTQSLNPLQVIVR